MINKKYKNKKDKTIVTVKYIGAPMNRPDVVWFLEDGKISLPENENK